MYIKSVHLKKRQVRLRTQFEKRRPLKSSKIRLTSVLSDLSAFAEVFDVSHTSACKGDWIGVILAWMPRPRR